MHNTGLAMGSMDVVIDDGDHHYAGSMDKTLQVVWPYLRAGGYYIVEDVATGANFGTRLARLPQEKSVPGRVFSAGAQCVVPLRGACPPRSLRAARRSLTSARDRAGDSATATAERRLLR